MDAMQTLALDVTKRVCESNILYFPIIQTEYRNHETFLYRSFLSRTCTDKYIYVNVTYSGPDVATFIIRDLLSHHRGYGMDVYLNPHKSTW